MHSGRIDYVVEKQPKWKKVLLVLGLVALTVAFYLVIRHLLWNRRPNKFYPQWVNGDMEQSPSADARTTTGNNTSPSPAIAPSFGQLGCTGHGRQVKGELTVGRKTMKVFDYHVLSTATDGFKRGRVLGQLSRTSSSAARTLFLGKLLTDEGLDAPVVIKRLTLSEEAINHVQEDLKGKKVLQHRNLLCPLGYCFKKEALYVVYEHMVNGSLNEHLFPKEPRANQRLSWAQRCRIIKNVAAGLQHLHRNSSIHGSVKASNILLDQDMTPRLGDFGLSAAALEPSSAPDCSTDVFSFGTVIVDVFCGERWNKERCARGTPAFWFLVGRAWDLDGCILGAIDADLAAAGDFDEGQAEKMLQLGLACSHPDPTQRPDMEEVVDFLAGKAALPEVPLKKKD
ncbi:unnamed protein product [Urochloa humidicola]